MAFISFKKNKCLIVDELFLELTWTPGKSPEEDSELLGIIEGLDKQYLDTFQHTIEESLPYVTFFQAELLFQELLQVYGHFQLEKVAVAHLEGKEVITEGEVFASPFIIDKNYQNLLLLLIQSIMTQPEFSNYGYQEKREYFENQIYPAYKRSLGILDSQLPLFPVEGEQIAPVASTQFKIQNRPPLDAPNNSIVPKQRNFNYVLFGIIAALASISLCLSIFSIREVSQKKEQVNYLYQELKDTEHLLSTKNEVDVFSRYFIPTYYSDNKDALSEFLSDGDAKYTVPQSGIVQSVILENISYDSETKEYSVTYVISKKQDETVLSIRLQFNIQSLKSAKYGFVVVTEPKESEYIKN